MRILTPSISPVALNRKIQRGDKVHLVDVRTPEEFADQHAAGAISVPLDRLESEKLRDRLGAKAGDSDPVYLICASGMRAERAADTLHEQGMPNLMLVEGGTDAWRSSQLPVRRTSKLLSLERQTQIALGVLLIAMLLKGSLLHPVFLTLIGLIGVGLIVAGMTARCGLTALLARMPWNRAQTGAA